MQVVLSRDILQSIRHLAGEALPGMKSSHVAEAVASALGHRTNAALVGWIKAVPASKPAIGDLEPAAASSRLCELGYEAGADEAPAAISAAVQSCGAATVNGPYDEMASGAVSVFKAGGWDALSNPGRLVYMAFLFGWRMGKASDGILDFVENYAEPGQLDLHLRLAAVFQSKRDVDRTMADFLVEFLLAADGELPADGGSRARLRWGEAIHRGFTPRIAGFVDAVCRTWPGSVDPLGMTVSPQLIKRLGRSPFLVERRAEKDHEIGLGDTGYDVLDMNALVGACCLARLRAGDGNARIVEFADKAMTAGENAVDICLSQVPFSGAGTAEARAILARMLLPTAAGGRS